METEELQNENIIEEEALPAVEESPQENVEMPPAVEQVIKTPPAVIVPQKEEIKIDPIMLFNSIYLKPSIQIPEDFEVTKAKSFLKGSNDGKPSLYDHMASVVMKVLETRPSNALGIKFNYE